MKNRMRNKTESRIFWYTMITLATAGILLVALSVVKGEQSLKPYKPVDSIEEMREYHEARVQEMYPNENVNIILFE